MSYLILSILFSSSLLIFFKLFDRYKVDALPAITINYIVASIVGFIFIEPNFILKTSDISWHIIAGLLGCMFAIVFNLSKFATQKIGMSLTSVAMKLGVVFPVIIGILIYHESFKIVNYIGLIIGIVAILLINKPSKSFQGQISNRLIYILPLLVWFGSGICDSTVQLAHKKFALAAQNGSFGFIAFWMAGLSSLIFIILKGRGFNLKSIIGGIGLGIPNYFSIYFLVKCLESMQNEYKLSSSNIFMINNISIVILSIAIGVIFFKERLNVYNILGIGFALISLILISI